MANRDLRDWIEGVRAAGELKIITGAEPKEEIGGIVDIYMRRMGNPAVLFEGVPGFPKGHRVIANILTSIPRVNLALGLPPQTPEMEQIQWWRNYFKSAPSHPTKAVNGGPLLDNVFVGSDVDIEKIPTPVWHEQDGRAVYRHRLPRRDEGSRFRLDQLRMLSRAVARAERRLGDDVAGQARPDHHAQIPRARRAMPGRRRRRHAPGAGDAGRHRGPVRQERAGGGRRHFWR